MTDPHHETEVKIRIEPEAIPGLREKAYALGFRQTAAPKEEKNLLFDFPDGRLRESGTALRLRQYGDQCRLTFKGPRIDDPLLKIRLEEETAVGDFGTARRILEQIGLQVSFRYDKTREKHLLESADGRVELCIDQTPVGCFAEIEGSPEAIGGLAQAFGWSRSEFLNVNYVDLYAEQGLGG